MTRSVRAPFLRQNCKICGRPRAEHGPKTDHDFKTILGNRSPERFTDLRKKPDASGLVADPKKLLRGLLTNAHTAFTGAILAGDDPLRALGRTLRRDLLDAAAEWVAAEPGRRLELVNDGFGGVNIRRFGPGADPEEKKA